MTELEKLAHKISKMRTSCKKCVYESGIFCNYPHSDAYIIENNVDVCFEGVYKYLVEQEEKHQSGTFYIIANEEAKCGSCRENINLGKGSAPFDINYCPHCGTAFSYGAVYCKDTIAYLKKTAPKV